MNYLIETWFGYFVVDSSLDIIEKELYPREIDSLIEKNQQKKELEEYEQKMDLSLKRAPSSITKKFKEKYWSTFFSEYEEISNEFFVKFAKLKIEKGFEKKGESIIRAINLLEDLNKTLSILDEGTKDFFDLFGEEKETKDIYKKYSDQKNLDLEEKTISSLSQSNILLKDSKEKLKEFIEEKMNEHAPNLSEIAGETLGAKLITQAGGLNKLAKKPAGTIQLLGAEKALFRHLENGTNPPKHGVIFEHPYVRNTHWSKRGKIARTLASKIAIASRIDYFTKEKKSESIKKELEARVKEVRQN